MKNEKVRLTSRSLWIFILTIVITLSLLGWFNVIIPDANPVNALPGSTFVAQDGDYTYSVTGNPPVATVIGYTGLGGAISIPLTLGGYPVAHIGIDAFDYITTITSVIMPSSLISINDQAFQYCTSLINVTFGNNVRIIRGFAFNHCTSLSSIIIPNSVTDIGDSVFAYCTNLTSVVIGSGVTSIGMVCFDSCSSLTSITFLGLVAPTYVGAYWIQNTNLGLRGHAYNTSNFPAPGGAFYGLIMGDTIYFPPIPEFTNMLIPIFGIIGLGIIIKTRNNKR